MMDQNRRVIVGLGELVWDLLPTGKQLGGAPANFVYNANCLGDLGLVATAVGNDQLGRQIIDRFRRIPLSLDYLQVLPDHPTGTVPVEVDDGGQPTFSITQGVAWDFLEWTCQWQELAASADAVCFGSLAQRSPQSSETIRSFLKATRTGALRVFDVNVRDPFYSADVLLHSLKLANIVKLTDQELTLVMRTLGFDDRDAESSAWELLRAFQLQLVCVTRGASGGLLVSADEVAEHPGFPVKVADTVGAGDAFTAILTHLYLRGASLETIVEAGNRLGSWVASQPGATPPATRKMARAVLQRVFPLDATDVG